MTGEKLTGTSLVGGKKSRERVEHDYYATAEISTISLLNNHKIKKGLILEPACGQGHIIKVLKEHIDNDIIASDIIEREKICDFSFIKKDFLNAYYLDKKPRTIITNPPFSHAQEFIERAIDLVGRRGEVIMFAKIQLLESMSRKKMFEKYPPKYVYVFSERQPSLPNGNPLNENGKKWANTMCYAWFVWKKGFTGEPIIRWI